MTPDNRPRAGFPANAAMAATSMAYMLMAFTAHASGIKVRFLAAVPGDSVARYDVWRAAGPGQAALVGSLAAPFSGDTLSYPDSSAARGTAYAYSIRAVDAAGNESDASETTWVALPRLALPDTARQPGGALRLTLPPETLPLRGHAQPSFAVEPAGSFRLVFDSAAGTLEFLPAVEKIGRADTLRAVVRMGYYGKFEDADTVTVLFAGTSSTAVRLRAMPDMAKAPAPLRGRIAVAAPGGRTLLYDPAGRFLKALSVR